MKLVASLHDLGLHFAVDGGQAALLLILAAVASTAPSWSWSCYEGRQRGRHIFD